MDTRRYYMLVMPFAIRSISIGGQHNSFGNLQRCIPQRLVVVGGNERLLKLSCNNNDSVLVPLIDGQTVSIGDSFSGCRPGDSESKVIAEGPHAIIYERRGLFSQNLLVLFRASGCKRWDSISKANVVTQGSDLVSSFVLYKRAGEYLLILDTLSSFMHLRIGEKPGLVKYRNGVVALFFQDYVRLVNPAAGFVDVPSVERSLEPLGYSMDGDVLLYNTNDNVVYLVDKLGGIKPLVRCRDASPIPSYEGYSILDCDGRIMGGSSALASYALNLVKRALALHKAVVVFPYVVVTRDNEVSIIELGRVSSILFEVSPSSRRLSRAVGAGKLGESGVSNLVSIMESEIFGKLVDAEIRLEGARLWTTNSGTLCLRENYCGQSILEAWGKLVGIDSVESIELLVGDNRVEPLTLHEDNNLFHVVYVLGFRPNASRIALRENATGALAEIERIREHQLSLEVTVMEVVPRGLDIVEVVFRVDTNMELYKLLVLPRFVKARVKSAQKHARLYSALVPVEDLVNSDNIGVVGVNDNGILLKTEARLVKPLEDVLGSIERFDIDIRRGRLYIVMELSRPGYLAARVNGLDVVVEAGPRLPLRVPGGPVELTLRDARGVRNLRLFGPTESKVNVGLLDRKRMYLGCSYECIVLCYGKPLNSGTVVIDIERLLDSGNGACKVINIGYGFVREHRLDAIRALMLLGARAGIALAQLLKLR